MTRPCCCSMIFLTDCGDESKFHNLVNVNIINNDIKTEVLYIKKIFCNFITSTATQLLYQLKRTHFVLLIEI